MDGLMIDSEPLWFSVERDLAQSYGHEWTHELALECVGTGLPNTARIMAAALGLNFAPEDGARMLIDRFVDRVDDLVLKPGCVELIEAAERASIPRAVASSSTPTLIGTVLERFDLTARFDAVVSGESVANSKPAPDIFVHTAELLSTEPADCTVLEDSIPGVTAGRAANMQVVAVPEIDDPRFADIADCVLKDLHEARRWLEL